MVARGSKTTQAAHRIGVDQAKVSALLHGRLEGFSIERLIRFLSALDQEVEVRVNPRRAEAGNMLRAARQISNDLRRRGVEMKTYKSGEKAPDSGELVEIAPRGGKVDGGRPTVIERGERIPPSSEEGNLFKYMHLVLFFVQ